MGKYLEDMMDTLKIDIKGKPLTTEQLDDLRRSAIEQRQSAIRNKQRLKWVSSLLFILFLIASYILYSADNAAVAVAGIVVGIPVGVVVCAGLMYLFGKLNNQIYQIEAQLWRLIELNANNHPDLCIAYDALYTQDKTIGSFQRQLAKQGRNPVVAEYETAKAWVEGSEKRAQEKEKQEAAVEACQRMTAYS